MSNFTESVRSLPIPQHVLVIGGGPSGLVALRNLTERAGFSHVELYERRDNVGGVWYFEDNDADGAKKKKKKPSWPSPAFKGLIGNVLPEFLTFSGHPFPEPPSSPHQPFPSLTETHNYLCNFAKPYLESGAIKLSREVVSVVELKDGKGWRVISRDWSDGEGREVEGLWDAVVVSVGWSDNPVFPETEGLDELRQRGLAKHAKWWRGPEGYEGKKSLVVGNANSSNDIAAQLAPSSNGPVYQSIRRPAVPGCVSLPDERIKMVAPISKYILKPSNHGDKFDALLADGTTLCDLDVVQLGTGYKPFPSFIRVLKEGHTHVPITGDNRLPQHVPNLHRLIMYANNPSLAFIGLPMAFTPFTTADVVSTWLSLAWRGDVPFPETIEGRLVFERERLAAIDKCRREMVNPSSLLVYDVLGADEQEYARSLREDIVTARPEFEKVLPVFNDERAVLRKKMFKAKFEALLYAREKGTKYARENGTK